ncbi:MAG: hypothetical protein IJ158_10420 [Treponema sp.]|nr:hypothetical protein [Treponema sp.]
MKKVVCFPEKKMPNQLSPDTKYFLLYGNNIVAKKQINYIAPSLRKDVIEKGIRPTQETWDFTTLALSVFAADSSISRKSSPDGWTRQIELTIYLFDVQKWNAIKEKIEKTLRFLTGDFWHLIFKDGGDESPFGETTIEYEADCISLLSGGLDSFVGGVDLVHDGHNPIFVSQTVKGDADKQWEFANILCGCKNFFQWSHKFHNFDNESEPSTRSRSIIFFAYAALASCALLTKLDIVPIYVCENGFISLNIPSTILRAGSLSTKTTHPIYMRGIQEIWDAVGIKATLILPYHFKTKGELLAECKDQKKLQTFAYKSTSCGKFLRNAFMHCGRCVPCLVRRAAFNYAQITDKTDYKFENLHIARRSKGADDLGSLLLACKRIELEGIEKFIGATLAFSTVDERKSYIRVIKQGYEELKALFIKEGVYD